MKINEIFASVQGEGYFQGTPAVFIRTSGCPNNCDFCDTKHESFVNQTPQEVIDEAKACGRNIRHIVLTGGEPMLQSPEELRELIDGLVAIDKVVQIETSGAGYHAYDFKRRHPKNVFVTLSPKTATAGNTYLIADEYKYLYPFIGLPVERHYNHVVEYIKYTRHGIITMQPMTVPGNDDLNKIRTMQCYEYCIAHDYIFSPRLHVLLRFR